MGTVYCNFCGEHTSYAVDAQCPNDVIQDTGYSQLENGLWICPECHDTIDDTNNLRIEIDK